MLWSCSLFFMTARAAAMTLIAGTGPGQPTPCLGQGALFVLDTAGFDMLVHACRYHSDGLVEGDVTVRTCWDADRLDLGRGRGHADRLESWGHPKRGTQADHMGAREEYWRCVTGMSYRSGNHSPR